MKNVCAQCGRVWSVTVQRLSGRRCLFAGHGKEQAHFRRFWDSVVTTTGV